MPTYTHDTATLDLASPVNGLYNIDYVACSADLSYAENIFMIGLFEVFERKTFGWV